MAEETTIGGEGALFVGEDKVFRLELLEPAAASVPAASRVPVDMSTWIVLFDVRKKDDSPDPAIFSKAATITGAYNVLRATNTQRAVVTLSDTEMNTVSAKTYRHSWKRMDDGSETVLAWGDYIVQKATAP